MGVGWNWSWLDRVRVYQLAVLLIHNAGNMFVLFSSMEFPMISSETKKKLNIKYKWCHALALIFKYS